MRLEDYTADDICRAMGLPGFVEQPWVQSEDPNLRLVLTPSFHPELCITLARSADGTWLSVVVLLKRLWAERSLVCLPHESEATNLPSAAFEEVLALFTAAHASFDPERRYVCVDGMGSASCLVSRTGTKLLDAHVSAHVATGQFIGRLIELAWNACCHPGVRNALAQAALYLGGEYPIQEVAPQPAVTRLAVLGTPEEKSQYLAILQQRKKGGPDTTL